MTRKKNFDIIESTIKNEAAVFSIEVNLREQRGSERRAEALPKDLSDQHDTDPFIADRMRKGDRKAIG